MKYLLTFKPLKHFFFGNERTFRKDYVAVSEYFPQPTQLLGALRLTIAQQHGLIKQYKNGRYPRKPRPVRDLTGSAKAHDFMHNDDLGKIRSLSSMFIVNKELDDAYFQTPFDVDIMFEKSDASSITEEEKILPISYSQKLKLNYLKLSSVGKKVYLKGYDVKKHHEQMLGNANFWSSYLEEKGSAINAVQPFRYDSQTGQGVFVRHMQVGIALNNKQTIDGKFYSKTDYTLSKNFLFAAVLDFDGEIGDDIIQLGAESSLFEMKVILLEKAACVSHPVISRLSDISTIGERSIAISDVMMEENSSGNIDFALVPYMKKMASVKMHKGRYEGLHTIRQLAPAGSVIYGKETKLNKSNIGAYGKMGYNQFITI